MMLELGKNWVLNILNQLLMLFEQRTSYCQLIFLNYQSKLRSNIDENFI